MTKRTRCGFCKNGKIKRPKNLETVRVIETVDCDYCDGTGYADSESERPMNR